MKAGAVPEGCEHARVCQQLTELMIRNNFDLDAAARELVISYRAMVERLRKLAKEPRIE